MTLSEITLPITYADAQQYALVFTPQIASWLADLHAQYGSQQCVPMPRQLTDGRLMLSADLLTEIEHGGLLHDLWVHIDHATVDPQIEVLPWDEAVALLPHDEVEQ